METIQYYGVVMQGRKIAEVLVNRCNGKQVSQKLTGVTYKNKRDAISSLTTKNVGKA
jgi:hypothetical protein